MEKGKLWKDKRLVAVQGSLGGGVGDSDLDNGDELFTQAHFGGRFPSNEIAQESGEAKEAAASRSRKEVGHVSCYSFSCQMFGTD